jgi:uncharacterized protein
MHVVLDTNLVVSGLLWSGTPRSFLDLGRTGTISLFHTEDLITELSRVLHMKKFEQRLTQAGVRAFDMVIRYRELSEPVPRAIIPPTIFNDPSDDEVLACAVSAEADAIGSGDHHLLDLRSFRGIPILRAGDLLALVKSQTGRTRGG